MLVAERIKAARDHVQESQSAFAERFGVDQSTIHRWETDGPPSRGPGRMAIERVLADIYPIDRPPDALGSPPVDFTPLDGQS